MFDVCFFIFRTFEPSAFAGFRGSSCCIFREFGVSGFRFSWVSGFWPSGFRVFDACFLARQLSGFLPFMFSSFRLSFFDLSPELSIVCSKFAFVSCVSLLFAVLRVFRKLQTTVFTRATTVFTRATTIFSHANDHFQNLLRLCLFLLMLVQRCFDFADSAPKSQEKTLAWLSLRWAQWPCLEVLARLRA